MIALIQLALPVVLCTAFIIFKLNHEQKRWLWRVPIWISSTAFSLGIGHLAGGVMGFYAAAICDLLLYPAMLMVKRSWDRKEKKLYPNRVLKVERTLALPQKSKLAMTN